MHVVVLILPILYAYCCPELILAIPLISSLCFYFCMTDKTSHTTRSIRPIDTETASVGDVETRSTINHASESSAMSFTSEILRRE